MSAYGPFEIRGIGPEIGVPVLRPKYMAESSKLHGMKMP